MIHTSINALIGFQLTQFIKNKKLLSTSIIIGIILPDIDLILDFIISLFYNYNFLFQPLISNSIFHSLLMIPFLSLLILIYLEYKNKNNPIIVIGLSIGMLAHIIIDIISMDSVGIFFPLFDLNSNFSLNSYFNFQMSENFKKILFALDFFFFRLYTWMIINLILKKASDDNNIIKKLSIVMKLQLYIFLIFLLLIYFDASISLFSKLFGLLYTPCFFMALLMTYKTRKIIN